MVAYGKEQISSPRTLFTAEERVKFFENGRSEYVPARLKVFSDVLERLGVDTPDSLSFAFADPWKQPLIVEPIITSLQATVSESNKISLESVKAQYKRFAQTVSQFGTWSVVTPDQAVLNTFRAVPAVVKLIDRNPALYSQTISTVKHVLKQGQNGGVLAEIRTKLTTPEIEALSPTVREALIFTAIKSHERQMSRAAADVLQATLLEAYACEAGQILGVLDRQNISETRIAQINIGQTHTNGKGKMSNHSEFWRTTANLNMPQVTSVLQGLESDFLEDSEIQQMKRVVVTALYLIGTGFAVLDVETKNLLVAYYGLPRNTLSAIERVTTTGNHLPIRVSYQTRPQVVLGSLISSSVIAQ